MLEFPERDELRGDRLLVATGRRPRTEGLGLETVGIEPTQQGIPVDDRMNVTDGVWAIGDATGIWPLTYVSKYQGRVAAANILGRPRTPTTTPCRAWCSPTPRPPSVGEAEGAVTATVPLAEVPRTSTYTRAYAEQAGLPDAGVRRRAAHRRLRARARRPASGCSRPRSRSGRGCRSRS